MGLACIRMGDAKGGDAARDAAAARDETVKGVASAVGTTVTVILALIAVALCIWATVIAFVGGTLPIVPITFTGFSLIRGLLWVFVFDTIFLTVLSWLAMLIAGGLSAVAYAIARVVMRG